MKVAYRYRIYPNNKQKELFNQFFYAYHCLYNIGVDIVKTSIVREQRKSGKTKTYKKDGKEFIYPSYKYPSKLSIQYMIYHLKDEEDCEWWSYVNPKSLERKDELKQLFRLLPANSISYIADAIRKSIDTKFNPNMAHSKGKKPKSLTIDNIEELDFTGLKFKKFNNLDCGLSVQVQNQSALKVVTNKRANFTVPKIGLVKMVYHRPIPENSKFDCVTISKKNDEYYISLGGLTLVEKLMIDKEDVKTVVGIDINTDNYIVSSDNETFVNPAKKLLKMKKHIKRMQRRNGENKKDAKTKTKRDYKSKNFKKHLLKVNKIYNKITNIKKNLLHNASKKFTSEYDVVVCEDLNVKAMQHFNGSMVQKNNFYEFKRQLEYKSLREGTIFQQVDRFFPSSQICSKCGKIHTEMKNLNKRVFKCDCGIIMARDLNAAKNIQKEGIKLLTNTIK